MQLARKYRYVVSVSSGAASAYAWHLTIQRYGKDHVVGLFADVNREHPDNYRFLAEVQQYLDDARLIKLNNDGKTIWDVFKQQRFLGNSRLDTCSKHLKRDAIARWLDQNCDPARTMVVLGLDWTEQHRVDRNKAAWWERGWRTQYPLADTLFDKSDAMIWLKEAGIMAPALYDLGFIHANCGGGCVKAGIKQFKHLLTVMPSEYAYWERREQEMRDYLHKDISILTDRRGGIRRPMTLRQLRLEVEATHSAFEDEEWGGCGCFTDLTVRRLRRPVSA
jgi:3'-phosphoadenosine 5'-phosphosulfate sulfotransferase (PAPS reductase)/FAD synthetase